jgi:hypothetical protein
MKLAKSTALVSHLVNGLGVIRCTQRQFFTAKDFAAKRIPGSSVIRSVDVIAEFLKKAHNFEKTVRP